MEIVKVEKGKLSGNYKTVFEAEVDGPGALTRAWAVYFKTEIVEGEQKRIKRGSKILRHQPCYWT